MKELRPLRFINTTQLWSAATSPQQPSADQHGARREGQALALVPEGVPPRGTATEACLESLVSDPATPPEAPAEVGGAGGDFRWSLGEDARLGQACPSPALAKPAAQQPMLPRLSPSAATPESADGPTQPDGGDYRWSLGEEARSGAEPSSTSAAASSGELARSDSEWAEKGYILLPTEDLLNEKVKSMVVDWGALGGYMKLGTDGAAELSQARLRRTEHRWVMLRGSPSPLVRGADAASANGYARICSPTPQEELSGEAAAPGAAQLALVLTEPEPEPEPEPQLDIDSRSPGASGEGCLPVEELPDYSTLPPLDRSRVATAPVPRGAAAQADPSSADASGRQRMPAALGGCRCTPGLAFDFVTTVERCDLYLTESHEELQAVAGAVKERRRGVVPEELVKELELQADGGRLAASRPLLQPAGGGKTNVLAAAGGAAGVGGAAVRPRQASIILSETELPNLAEWGL